MSIDRLKHTMRVVIPELPAKSRQINQPQKLTLKIVKIHWTIFGNVPAAPETNDSSFRTIRKSKATKQQLSGEGASFKKEVSFWRASAASISHVFPHLSGEGC